MLTLPPEHTPAPAGWRDDWGADRGVSSGALLSKNSSERFFFFFFFANIKGFMGFIEGTM